MRAQQFKVAIKGFLGRRTPEWKSRLGAFQSGLAKTGFVEEQNVSIDYRWAETYGGGVTEASREAGVYGGRILEGEKLAELPVAQVAKEELLVNPRTAATLGIAPAPILYRADEVIE